MIGWLLGTRIGRWIGGALAAAAAVFTVLQMAKRQGAKDALAKVKEADQERSNEIEKRADDALRKHDGDTRPVDERLRGYDRLRD